MLVTELCFDSVLLHKELKDKLQVNKHAVDIEQLYMLGKAVNISEAYMQKLYALLPDCFENVSAEILFFKTIKPLFIAERECYQRQYQAILFGVDMVSFWDQELTRIEKLLIAHDSFSRYYHSKQNDQDAEWFSQGQASLPTELCLSPWETNPRFTSVRDGWVGGLLAVEHYRDWVNGKIKSIQQSKSYE